MLKTAHFERDLAQLRPIGAVPTPAGGPAATAIVVLGCAVRLDSEGNLGPSALARRVATAAGVYAAASSPLCWVVVSGGRRWRGEVEADAMARELVRLGVPEAVVVRERCSMTTRENARFTARLLARRGLARAAIVSSEWHLPRAIGIFARAGVDGHPVPAADEPPIPWTARATRWARERALAWAEARLPCPP